MAVEKTTFSLTDAGEVDIADSIDELLGQKLEKRIFSDEPAAATDHSSCPHKGQIPTCDTCAQEFHSRMRYEEYRPEHYGGALNTVYLKAKVTGRVCFNAVIPKMRPMLNLIPKLTFSINAVKQMKEMEKRLARETVVVKELESQKDNIIKELLVAKEQTFALERQLAASVHAVQMLEDDFISADLERENIVREVEELRKRNTLVTKEVKIQKDNVLKELLAARKQISALRRQLDDSDQMVKVLEDKNGSALELLITSEEERDEIQLERDSAIREAEELRQGREDVTASLQMMQFFSVFSLMEIEKATQDFDPWLIIGRGGYGDVYRGTLRNTDVAIKILHPNSSQGQPEFQNEVDVLSRVRHPNLVTLIGTCPEASALIYEYLPNGSLEDLLAWEKNKTLPLSWQTRTRIAVEICSALIFLHSNKPHGIIHGDLKPANVLLDANFVSKLGDFGICRLVRFDGNSTGSTTPVCETTPKGTFGYMDPEFFSTGELTPKSDVFAFGIVLLQLLTRKPAMGLVDEVKTALDKRSLSAVLDTSAGEWPLIQANELAELAIKCCKINRRSRPDLGSEVWRVLKLL